MLNMLSKFKRRCLGSLFLCVELLTSKWKLSFPACLKFCIGSSMLLLYFAIMIWKPAVKSNRHFRLEKQNALGIQLVFALNSELYCCSFIIQENICKKIHLTPGNHEKIHLTPGNHVYTLQNFNRLSHVEKSRKI